MVKQPTREADGRRAQPVQQICQTRLRAAYRTHVRIEKLLINNGNEKG